MLLPLQFLCAQKTDVGTVQTEQGDGDCRPATPARPSQPRVVLKTTNPWMAPITVEGPCAAHSQPAITNISLVGDSYSISTFHYCQQKNSPKKVNRKARSCCRDKQAVDSEEGRCGQKQRQQAHQDLHTCSGAR